MQIGLVAAAIAIESTAPSPEVWFTALAGYEENDALLREAAPAEALNGWITPADIPTNAAPPGQSVTSITLRLQVGASGGMLRCTPEKPGLLATIACAKLRERGRFVPALDRSGRAVADTLAMELEYSPKKVTRIPASAPPELKYLLDGQLMEPGRGLHLVSEPKLPVGPAKTDAELVVSIASYQPQTGEETVRCRILVSSGDSVLDRAGCDALKEADRRREGNSDYVTLTAMIRWTRGKAELVLPSRQTGTDLFIDKNVPGPKPAIPEGARPGTASLTFAADGARVRCKVEESTGSDSLDLTACLRLETMHYRPAIDVFGRPRDVTVTATIGRR